MCVCVRVQWWIQGEQGALAPKVKHKRKDKKAGGGGRNIRGSLVYEHLGKGKKYKIRHLIPLLNTKIMRIDREA